VELSPDSIRARLHRNTNFVDRADCALLSRANDASELRRDFRATRFNHLPVLTFAQMNSFTGRAEKNNTGYSSRAPSGEVQAKTVEIYVSRAGEWSCCW
jgi:hypothetical protein